MVTDLTRIRLEQFPKNVVDYASAQGMAELLPEIGHLTQRLVPGAQLQDTSLEDDPEIDGLRFIVFRGSTSDSSVIRAKVIYDQWMGELREICPDPNPFVLSLQVGMPCGDGTSCN